jgi:hypothetical protein
MSYDPVGVLAAFAATHAITYSLLSDEGSHVLRRLGLINERVADDHAAYGIASNARHQNLPYPGVFVLNEQGVVTIKRFHDSYRVRDTGDALLEHVLGIAGPRRGVEARAAEAAVTARAWLDSPTYAWYQRLHLTVELEIRPGLQVRDIDLTVTPLEGVEVGPAAWPETRECRTEGIPNPVWGHEGHVRGVVPLTFIGPQGSGDRTIDATLRFQACRGTECLPPSSLRVAVRVREAGLIGRPLPGGS